MRSLAATLQAFFSVRLLQERRASPNTVASYRDTFKLLLSFVHLRTGKPPAEQGFEDLEAPTVGAFLQHLETKRHNSVSTRNTRLAAIHSFFTYASFVHPEHAERIMRVLAIPNKRCERALVSFLDRSEIEAIVAVPDRSTYIGRRDHALLTLAAQTGLRLSELTGLRRADLHLASTGAHVRCEGKGRKQRTTPLTRQTVAVLTVWLNEVGPAPDALVFPSRLGGPLSPDAFQRLVRHYTELAATKQSSLNGKHVTPHVFRHSAAMELVKADVDISTIAMWLGHEHIQTVMIYLHADLRVKERALARIVPAHTTPGRFRPSDALLGFLTML